MTRDPFETPIFVLGLPRTGTSMIAGALGICGAWTGSTVPGGAPNPKGFFEHAVIREQVTKQILARLGCDPLGINKLPPVDLDGEVPQLARAIREIIETDGYTHDEPWLYKDAKLALLWPLFKKAFPDSTWVVVRRDEEGFVNSCLRTYFMRLHSQEPDFWRTLGQAYRARIQALKDSGAPVLEISSPEVIKGDLDQFRELVSRLGLAFREEALQEFITPVYWHGDASGAN